MSGGTERTAVAHGPVDPGSTVRPGRTCSRQVQWVRQDTGDRLHKYDLDCSLAGTAERPAPHRPRGPAVGTPVVGKERHRPACSLVPADGLAGSEGNPFCLVSPVAEADGKSQMTHSKTWRSRLRI